MKIILQITIIAIILSCCSSTSKTNLNSELINNAETPYFEGEIHFTITYDSVPSNMNSKFLEDVIGSKMILVFKNGNHRKEYYSPQGKLISQRFLDLSVLKSFNIRPDEDTVFWFDITKPDSKTNFTKINDTIIKDYKCITIRSKTLTPNPQNKEQNLVIKSIYQAATELAVNPTWFSEYNEGNFNEMIKLTKSLVIETYEKGPFWNTTIIADKIIWRKVKNNELEIENLKGRPLKEL